MGLTVDIPAGTKAVLFDKLDQTKKTAKFAAIGLFALAGAFIAAPIIGAVLRSKERRP